LDRGAGRRESDARRLLEAIEDHILAQARLVGIYEK
jgi:phosphatidylethanolamine-binding protein (PEBP) family uncharacterized protein